jgi:phosphohistidine phosphatase
MKLLIIRHAIAAPRGTPGIADDDRPLTAAGIRKFRRAAAGLARITPRPDLILTSPLPRARSTAEIAARAWGSVPIREDPALAGGNLKSVLAALEGSAGAELIALVGHEPQLSALLARLIDGGDSGRLPFRKGGAALVELPAAPAAGGTLVWFLPPRLLRSLESR